MYRTVRPALLLMAGIIAGCACAQNTPLVAIDAFAWLGNWSALQSPSVTAPETDGEATGSLNGVFDVTWKRDGERYSALIKRVTSDWCGRVAIRFTFAGDTRDYTYAVHELPVRIPLQKVSAGHIVSSWAYGSPRWMMAESRSGSAGVLVTTTSQHGFFVYRSKTNTIDVHMALDCSKVGQEARMDFTVVKPADATSMQAAEREQFGWRPAPPVDKEAAAALRATGMVRVDDAGRAFVDGTGKPWYAVGCNLAHLMTLSEADQEEELARAQAAGMTVIRFLIPDWCYRPAYGVWNEEAFRRLHACIERCAAHGLRVLICLEYSAIGSQFNASLHLSPVPGDLYILNRPLDEYREVVERIVVPLKDDPAVFAWDVSNEPMIEPDGRSPQLKVRFRDWLRAKYGTADALRTAWGEGAPEAFEQAELPGSDEYDGQETRRAKDFFAFAARAVGESMVARLKLVKAADPVHPVTIGHWHHRLLSDVEGAEGFDFWAYHTYDLWMNGPAISHHVLYLAEGLRNALPDRPRPVIIEEFGIDRRPQYPDEMRAEHIRQFLEAGKRWGLAGVMHWWEMSPAMYQAYRDTMPYQIAGVVAGPVLGVYLPRSQEWQAVFYPRYMTRRLWGQVLQSAAESGWQVRFVSTTAQAAECDALLVLADSTEPEEGAFIAGAGLRAHFIPGGEEAAAGISAASVMPKDAGKWTEYWKTAQEGL